MGTRYLGVRHFTADIGHLPIDGQKGSVTPCPVLSGNPRTRLRTGATVLPSTTTVMVMAK